MQRRSVFSTLISTRSAVGTSLLLAIAMAASACGAGSSTEAAGVDEVAAEFESPLGDFLGWTTDFNSDDEQAKYQEIERKAQEAAAVCMKAEGFEYTPVDYGQFENFAEEEEGLQWGTRAWGEKYGFGISTQRFSQEEVGPDLIGHTFGDFAEETFVDPNEAYVDSLPEAEQEVYYETLYGKEDGPEWDDSLSEDENNEIMEEFYNENYEPTGCMNVAYQESSGEDAYQEFDEAFGDLLQEMEERFESDPRVVARRSEVTSCVAEKGFDYTDEEAVYQDIEERMSSFANGPMGDPFNGVDPETLSDEEIDAIFAELNGISDEDKVELAIVQEYELGLAAAVMDCSDGALSSYVDPVLVRIRIELEQEFLDNNADELARFKGTMGGG